MSQVEDVEQFVSQLKVVELREELKKRHLPYAGNKKDLAQRLQESMLKEKEQLGAEDGATEEESPAQAEVIEAIKYECVVVAFFVGIFRDVLY